MAGELSWLERGTHKPEVSGSIPLPATIKKMKDIYITWENYHKKIEQLAKKIYLDNCKFNQVICIAKGGLRVGDVFSRLFNVPLAILSVESYHGKSNDIKNQQGQFTFSRDLAKTTPNLGSHILLVDDLADSGKTLTKSIKWLELFYGFYLEEKIKTAVIWHKSTSTFKPDYSVDYLEDSPWIHMPFEKYETTNIKDFKFE